MKQFLYKRAKNSSQQKYNKTVQVQVTIIPRQPGKELSVVKQSQQIFSSCCTTKSKQDVNKMTGPT